MKRIVLVLAGLLFFAGSICTSAEREVDLRDKRLFSKTPPFSLLLPTPFRLVQSLTSEHPEQSSRTRAYFLITEKARKVEGLILLQIAQRTDPRADPMTAPPLRPSSEERTYSKGNVKQDGREIAFLVQLMKWNPSAPALKPIVQQGFLIPSHLALQGQFQLVYDQDHAVLVWYSRDVQSFGWKVSDRVNAWEKGILSGSEKRAVQAFEKSFLAIIKSMTFTLP
jgi:hypothetical protein